MSFNQHNRKGTPYTLYDYPHDFLSNSYHIPIPMYPHPAAFTTGPQPYERQPGPNLALLHFQEELERLERRNFREELFRRMQHQPNPRQEENAFANPSTPPQEEQASRSYSPMDSNRGETGVNPRNQDENMNRPGTQEEESINMVQFSDETGHLSAAASANLIKDIIESEECHWKFKWQPHGGWNSEGHLSGRRGSAGTLQSRNREQSTQENPAARDSAFRGPEDDVQWSWGGGSRGMGAML